MNQSAIVIFNPRSGAHKRRNRATEIQNYIQLLHRYGITAEPWPTTGPNDATRLAHEAVIKGVDLVIASGGDGTLNEVLQGMARSQIPLGIFPGGTANVLANDLNIPSNPEANARFMAAGNRRPITVGLAGNRYFFLMAGIGLDAAMVKNVDASLKAKLGEGAYLLSGLQHLVKQPQTFTVEVNGQSYQSGFVVIGNSKGYGGGFSLTPHASLFDPHFEVSIFPPKSFGFEYLPFAITTLVSSVDKMKRVIKLQSSHIKAYGLETNQPWVQVDGELLGPLPMEFSAIPHGLTIIHSEAGK